MPEKPKEPAKEGFKLQWAESDGQASAQSLDKEHTNIEATTPEKRHHIINEVSYTMGKPIEDVTCTKTQPMNEILYTEREPTNESDSRMRGKAMVIQSSSNHVPIEVRNTKTITDTKLTNNASTIKNISISCLKTTESHQDLIIYQPLQTEDREPDDIAIKKNKRSMFKTSPDNRPGDNIWEQHINLPLAATSSTSQPAPSYRPSKAMLGHNVKLPPNLLEPYPKPGKPPDYFVMAIRDHNTMMGEQQYQEGDRLLLIRRGSKFDPGPFTITERLGPSVYRIRSQKTRGAQYDQLGLTVEGTPKWVESD